MRRPIYPFVNAGGLGGRGVYIGRSSGGGAFCFDPWVLYGDGALDDPNVIVLGKLGQGKSAFVKTLLWRMLLFGRRAFVLDVKREYGPLCDRGRRTAVSLRPGRRRPASTRWRHGRRSTPSSSCCARSPRRRWARPLTQAEAGALREALRVVRDRSGGEPTLPEVASLLFAPVDAMVRRLQTTADGAGRRRAPGRAGPPGPVRGTAARDVRRAHLAGLDLDARLLVLDLNAVRDSPAVGILMACASAWISALLARTAQRPGRERLISVADESWKIVQHTGWASGSSPTSSWRGNSA